MSLYDLAMVWSPSSAALTLLLPYVIVLLFTIYYLLFKRTKNYKVEEVAPFIAFYDQLTKGASAGYDKELLNMFHPILIGAKDGDRRNVGALRAMARGAKECFGSITKVDKSAIIKKQSGMTVTCSALVDFEKVKHVKCDLTYVLRLPSIAKAAPAQKTDQLRERVMKGLKSAASGSFHVLDFRIVPPKGVFDFAKYVDLDDFMPFAELVVIKLLTPREIKAFVEMCTPSLKDKYDKDPSLVETLASGVRKTLSACGGPKDGDIDPVLVDRKVHSTPPQPLPSTSDKPVSEILDFEMEFIVEGNLRHVLVHLRFEFSHFQLGVSAYNVTLQPDQRTQVVVDTDTRETTIVG